MNQANYKQVLINKIKVGMSWSLIGSLFSKLMTLFAAVYTARYLGKDTFGAFGLVQSTIGFFGVFAGAGMGLTGTRYISRLHMNNKEKASKIIGLMIIFSVVCFVIISVPLFMFSKSISANILNNGSIWCAVRLGIILLFCNVFLEMISGLLAGFEDFKGIAKGEIVRGLLTFPFLYFLINKFGLNGAILAVSFATLLGSFVMLQKLFKKCVENGIKIIFKDSFKEIDIIIHFSLPSLIASSLPIPVIWVSHILLTSLPNGYGELGIYNASNQFRMVIMILPLLLNKVLVPLLSIENSQKNMKMFGNIMDITNSVTISLVLPLGTLLIFFGQYVMALYGKDFISGWVVFNGMICGTIISAIGSVIGSAIAATGYMWVGALQNFFWGLIYICIVFLGYRENGAEALSFAFMIAHLALLIMSVIFLKAKNIISTKLFVNIILSSFWLISVTLSAQYIAPNYKLFTGGVFFFASICLCIFVILPISIRKQIVS